MSASLEVRRVTAGYGRVEVLHDLSMQVPAGSVVALLGANGAGKPTTLRVLSALLPVRSGRVLLDGRTISNTSPYAVARAGVVHVPEGRGVFPGLSVRDNLEIAARATKRPRDERSQRTEQVLEQFPRLRERMTQKAGTLSGGEQQMLAVSRAFLTDPSVLLMDEISMGLAPRIVAELFDAIEVLKEQGLTIVLVEQFLSYALRVADICYVMAKGRIVFVGEPGELRGGTLAGYVGAA